MKNTYDAVFVGGGAAGFFAAIQLAEQQPNAKILILEKTQHVLQKVKISGGGRCNVTHAVFEPKSLAQNYPRGNKELLGPFHQFMTGDMMAWLEENEIATKIENDGRVFPVSDQSQTIIDCFLHLCKKHQIEIFTSTAFTDFNFDEATQLWNIMTTDDKLLAKHLILATGSSPKVWKFLSTKGIEVVSPVPSLFTFDFKDASRIKQLAGISTEASVKVTANNKNVNASELKQLTSEGPLLITHWGMSGPCILKLSAWGARTLFKLNYQFDLHVNWTKSKNEEEVFEALIQLKNTEKQKQIGNLYTFDLPKRLWKFLLEELGIDESTKAQDLTHKQLRKFAAQLTNTAYEINGKSTFKEEFVTAGGVDLKQIDFKDFSVKNYKNLYMLGEMLNIDAVTGGFNFQNAWTGGFVVAKGIAASLNS